VRCVWKPLEIRHSPVLPCPEETGMAPCWAPGLCRRGWISRTVSTEAAGCRIESTQDAKKEIVVRL